MSTASATPARFYFSAEVAKVLRDAGFHATSASVRRQGQFDNAQYEAATYAHAFQYAGRTAEADAILAALV